MKKNTGKALALYPAPLIAAGSMVGVHVEPFSYCRKMV